ncbi:alpha/beta hydrolase [Nonomuraea deserti]|uniref:Alpha/beta hydrolase n=1 Tax=Nonomuraea deserti TaxID=1848322 RepID=A0A4R4W749_9ACTN|nr:alpha/beta hydrolase [Nonomuraea deserti]TDD12817.1 alpha/beta hydrolase [Nonomuraea deserti]
MSTHTESGTWKLRHRVRVSGGEVATDVFGQGSPVILIHGTPASSFLWREVVPILAREHAVHVWDLLGYGDSQPAPGVVPSIDLQARTLAELVRHWDLGAPALVGHDIGGAAALRAHLVHGVPVRRLALLDAAVLGAWLTPFTHHMRTHAGVYRTMPAHVFADIIRPRLHTATHRPMPEAVASAYLAPWDGAAGQQRWIDQVEGVSDDETRDIEARLHEITVPAHVLWGGNDEWLPPATAARLAAAIPGAGLTMIPDAGHFLPEDSPYDTAQALLRFLD